MPSRERLWNAAILVLILAGLLVGASRTYAELDLWGHLSWGQAVLDAGRAPRVDPFSYLTEGYPWTDHEWLGDVLMALAWNAAGAPGLLLLKLAAWLAVFGLALAWLRRAGLPLLRAGLLVLLGALLLSGYAIAVRPQVFTVLAFALMLLALLLAEEGRRGWLWGLPPLFLLWANLHGAWLAGLGLLAVWTGVHLLAHRNKAEWLAVLPPVLLSGLVTLINPFGVELWTFLVSHLGLRRLEVAEWRPLELHSRFGWLYLAWLGLVIAGLVFSRRRKAPGSLVLLALAAYLPFIAQRHVLFFALAALLVAGPHIGSAWERWMPVRPPPARRPLWALLLPLLAAGLLLALRPPNLRTIELEKPARFPAAAAALLQASGARGNLANSYNWGNYLSWRLAPAVKVAVDTRREMAYPEATFQKAVDFMLGRGDWGAVLEDGPAEMALVEPGSPPDNLLRLHADWQEIYRDGLSVLFARKGSQAEALLKAALPGFRPPGGESFP